MNIVKKLCPQERYDIKCPYLREPDRIVVHNTANDAPAANEINYMINRPEEVSFHFAGSGFKGPRRTPRGSLRSC